MQISSFIARRYLGSKKHAGFITVITSISIIGITVGVAALIIVLSVFNGFNGLVSSILIGFDPHLRIESRQGGVFKLASQITTYLSDNPEIKGASPFVYGKAMIVSRDHNHVIFLKGIVPSLFGSVSGVKERIVLGKYGFGENEDNGIIIGMALADRLNAMVGDTIAVVSPGGIQATLTQMVQPDVRKYVVSGIFESNNKDYDGLYGFISLKAAQQLFDMGNDIHGIEVRLNIFENTEIMKRRIEGQFPQTSVSTWYDLHKDLYTMMNVERWAAYIILCLIIAVATFNLLGSLTMSVIEKTRDIGILRSMGASHRNIAAIFLFEGAYVGIIGTLAGSGIGYIMCILQQKYHLFPLDPTVYIIPAIPVEVHIADFILVGLTAILLSTIAAWYPARRAAVLLPAEAVQWE
ncbi:MAG: FtsX-like permease family protein [Bacteroidota bacterium]